MGKTLRKSQPQARSRTTRSHKPRLFLSDPSESSAHLASQLRGLGLYPADTLGDGNCLFRALSDQLYGSPTRHAALRQAICDFIIANKSRYEPFCEDERGLDVHIRCMRENGTYGGHLELSSFAHMVKRDVKVVQPGLVYVIEWCAGLDEEEKDREWRKRRKEEERENFETCQGTIYVAYHDWEHFSSIRNLAGPHAGLPNVVEAPPVADDTYSAGPSTSARDREKEAKKERERERREKEKAKKKITKVKLKLSAPPSTASTPPPPVGPGPSIVMDHDPTHVPLTPSRSTSASRTGPPHASVDPLSSLSPLTPPSSSSSNAGSLHLTPPGLSPGPSKTPASYALPLSMRVHRSPKRSFDESASSEDGQSVMSDEVERGRGRDKRSRMGSVCVVAEGDVEAVQDGEDAHVVANTEMGEGVNREDIAALSDDESSQLSPESDGDDEEEKEDGEQEPEKDGDEDAEVDAEVAVDIVAPSPTPAPGMLNIGQDLDDDEGYSSLSSVPDSRPASPAPATKLSVKKAAKLQKMNADGKQLTRRQRKALGLPKQRGVSSAGKIVIPGGKFKGRNEPGLTEQRAVGNEEWVKTGVGRVDVRGFRELKI